MNDHCITKIDDTRFFLAGAKLAENSFSDHAYIYDQATHSWTQVADMAVGRNGLSCAPIVDQGGDPAVLITVGYQVGWEVVNKTEIFNLRTLTWSSGPDYPIAMAYGITMFDSVGNYFLAGGIGELY